MFIVLTLHRESLRQMMNRGRVNRPIKIQVLQMLEQICAGVSGIIGDHGDIKELMVFYHDNLDSKTATWENEKQPENILVDYNFDGTTVSNFKCYLANWGTSSRFHCGGTPVYAGPTSYSDGDKDDYSVAQLAMELFLDHRGKLTNFQVLIKFWSSNLRIFRPLFGCPYRQTFLKLWIFSDPSWFKMVASKRRASVKGLTPLLTSELIKIGLM